MSKKNRIVRDHDASFRIQAAKLVIAEGMSISKVARDLGVPTTTLHGWVRRFRSGEWSLDDSGTPSSSKLAANMKLPSSSQKRHDRLSDLESKNRELEAKLRRIIMERDILKKAMAYV